MSLIEKALQKMREEGAAPATGAAAAPSDGSPRTAVAPPVTERGPASATTRARTPKHSITLDSATLEAAGVVAPQDRRHQQVSDYRHIKRQVLASAATLAAAGASDARVIMVTSALPGEGKTFTSINLALSLALERDSSVLLIDGDVAKPSTSRLLNIDRYPGLLDALEDDAVAAEDLVLGTNVRGLSVLSAGRSSAIANESLSSARMEAVIAGLLEDPNRYVILDSPPLLVTTEAAALSHHAGQVVMVVRADSTVQRAVSDALHLLGERNGISLILNRVKHTRLEGYYYGYGYGYGYGDQSVPNVLGRE
jgi:exopolysaccharide/PEP-CTERM locus tyrosine autokinase